MALSARKVEKLAGKGRSSLRDHAAICAAEARERYAPVDYDAILRMLEDRKVVRYPTRLDFEATGLQPGEFAFAEPMGEHPRDGFRLHVHPRFEYRRGDLPHLIAYHLAAINYGDVVTREEAEVFAAALLGESQHEYYERVCRLADELPGAAEEAAQA